MNEKEARECQGVNGMTYVCRSPDCFSAKDNIWKETKTFSVSLEKCERHEESDLIDFPSVKLETFK